MANKCKRFLSLLLAFVMVLGMFPVGHAHAAGGATFAAEKVTSIEPGATYVICLSGTSKAVTNQRGNGSYANALTMQDHNGPEVKNMWTLEAVTGGYKLHNVNGYLEIHRNAGYMNTTGHAFELKYVESAGAWTIKDLSTNEFFNHLGGTQYGYALGGWEGDGTKFDLHKVDTASLAGVYGDKWTWTKTAVTTEAPNKNDTEGDFWMAWDNNPNTHWHSNYWGNNQGDKLTGENTISGEIDLGKEYTINQFSFTPRQNADSGLVTKAKLYVKDADDAEWKLVAEKDGFAADRTKKNFCFEAQAVRYVKFVAEQSHGGWVAVSEFDINYDANHFTVATEPATCKAPGVNTFTCGCGYSHTKEIPVDVDNHVGGTEIRNASVATMAGSGYTGDTYCLGCGNMISEGNVIPQLLAAAQLNGGTVVALENCEYTCTEGKLVHDGIYINVGNSGTRPGNASGGNTITVSQGNKDAVQLLFEAGVKDYYLHFYSKTSATWDRCADYHLDDHANGTHDLYLFKADENAAAGSLIPGYTKVQSLEENGKYLIVAKHSDGNYYVMAPSTSGTAADHIALLQTTHTHAYTWGVTTPATCTEAGIETGTCSCGETVESPITALNHQAKQDDGDCTSAVTCVRCDHVFVAAKTHVFDTDCTTDDKCANCDVKAESKTHVFDNNCTTADTCQNEGCNATATKAEAHSFDKDCGTNDKCANCDAYAGAKAHVFDTDCTTDDKCANCDVKAESKTHVFDNNCTTADTCQNAGCSVEAEAGEAHVFDNDCTSADKCANCEVTATATNHVAGEDDGDCTTAVECVNCEKNAVEADSHEWDNGTYTDPTFEADGFTTYKCTNNGCTKTNVVTDKGTMKVAVARIGSTQYESFQAAFDAAKASYAANGQNVTIILMDENGIIITEDTVVDLAGILILAQGDGFIVRNGATLTLNCGSDTDSNAATGVVFAGNGTRNAVWADGGHVIINGGGYYVGSDENASDATHQNDVIYTKNGGTVIINGGNFLNDGTVWTLNQHDSTGGKITVYGGQFLGWNPANNVSEGANTSFVADGYCVKKTVEGEYTVYTVQAHSYKATVTAPTCTDNGFTTHTCEFCGDNYKDTEVPALNHTFQREGGDTNAVKCADCGTANPNYKPVEVAPNVSFGAGEGEPVTDEVKNEIINAVQNNEAVNSYKPVENRNDVKELEITFTSATVKNETPTALVFTVTPKLDGQKVSNPSSPITFRLPVPATVAQAFAEVFHDGVQMPGLFEVKAENGNKYVEIESDSFSKFEVVFTDETPVVNHVAKIGEQGYATLQAAVEAAKAGDEIVLLADVTESVTLPAGVVFNGNGKTVSGTIKAGGNLTFKGQTTVSTFNPGWYNNTITIGEGASLKVTSGRMTVSYGNVFNITGSIVDAKTADKTAITPSLELVGGISYTGNGSGVQFNATNAYIKLGDSTTKNSAATGEFNMNFDNCIVDFTKTLKTCMPTGSGLAPKFNFNAKDSEVNFASHLELWLDATTMTLDNTDLTVGGSFANAGKLNVENGSNFVVKAPIMSSHGGNTGTIAVNNASFELKDSNEDWQNAGTMTAEGTGKLITNDFKNVNEGAVVLKSLESSFEGKQGITVTSEVEGYDVAYNETTQKYEFTKAPVAKIGEQKFQTLEAAFNAATSGCTIEILQDVTIDEYWDCRYTGAKFTVPVTIDGNGHTIKFTNTVYDGGNHMAAFRFEAAATVENLTIDMSNAQSGWGTRIRAISAKGDLTVDSCTFIGTGTDKTNRAIIFGEGAGSNAGNLVISVTDSTFINWSRGLSDNENAQDVKSITVTGNTFKDASVHVSASETVTFTGNTVEDGYVNIRSYAAENELKVTATGNTLEENPNNYIYAKEIDAQDEFTTKRPAFKVSTKAELDAALAAAQEGDTIVLTADIDYGTDHLKIEKAITLDLGDKTLTTRARNYGLALYNGCTVTNGKLNHAGTVAAIKVWDAKMISDLEIDVTGTSSSGNTIDGIVIQENATGVDTIKNVTIHSTSGQGVDSGIKTYNCGNATEPVIGSMEYVTVDAKTTGLNISAPCGTATNCSISGGVNAIELWIKGTYSASLTLEDSEVEGGVYVHDEFSSNPSVVNNGILSLVVDKDTTGVTANDVTLTLNRVEEEQVEGEVLENIIENAQAKVNGTYYATIAEAMKAAVAGDTVTILAGEYTTNLAVNKAITVVGETDADGKNLVKINGGISITANGAAIKNLTASNPATSGYNMTLAINAGDVLVEGCEITDGNAIRFSKATGKVTFKDSIITGSTYGIHFDGAAGGEIVIEGCVITGWTSFAASINKVTISDTEFAEGYQNQLRFYQDVEMTNVVFNPKMTVDFGKNNVEANFNNCSVSDGSALIDVIYLPDIAQMGVEVKIDNEPVVVVALIGNTAYLNLADAFAAAKDGDEIKIYTAGTYALATSGKDITITGMVDGVVFDNIGAHGMGGANVTFNNVTFDYYPNKNYTGLQHSGNLVYNNCIINGQVFLYGQSETFNNCTFNQNSSDAYNVWTYGAKEVDFNNCTFNSAGKSVLIYSDQKSVTNDVTVTGCEFLASNAVEGKAAIEMDSSISGEIKLTIDGETTATGFGTGNVSGNSLWNNKKGNNTDANNDITVKVGDETVLAPVTFVAQVGGNKYASLAAAIAAAQNGNTIEMLADVEATEVILIDKSLTINGNGHKVTSSASRVFRVTTSNVEVEMNNVNVVSTAVRVGTSDIRGIAIDPALTNVKLTLNGCSVDFTSTSACDWAYGVNIAGNGNGHTLTINGGSYEGANVINVYGANNTVTVKDATLTSLYPNNDMYYGACIWVQQKQGSSVEATGNTFEASNAIAFNLGTGTALTESNNTDNTKYVVAKVGQTYYYTLAEAVANVQAGGTVKLLQDVEENISLGKSIALELMNSATNAGTFTLTGKAVVLTAAEGLDVITSVADYKVTYADGAYKVIAKNYIAQIGTTQKFESLAEAVAAAQPGQTIKLIKSAEGPGVVIDKDITINFGGFTYTINEPVGSAGTESNGFQILSGNKVTLINGGMKVADSAADKFYTLIQNYADLTITHMTLDGTNLDKWSNTDGDSYVVSINSGNVIINGKTTITANDEGEKAFAFDVCKFANYAEPTVLVKGTATINGKIEAYVKIGEIYYATLQQAVNAADAKHPVQLIADASGAGVVIDKDLTIQFNGFTYTITEPVGSAGTESNGFQILNGHNVILKNGGIKVADSAADKFYILIQNYSNLTVSDMVLDGANLDKYPGESYVLSNNSGKVLLNGKTVINANEGEKAFAFDACKFANYDAPVVTVNATVTINGEVEAVAMIKNTYYATLQQAIDAASSGKTITLVGDINLNNVDPVLLDGSYNTYFKVEGKTVTIDLNGKTISGEYADTSKMLVGVFSTEKGGHLTLTGNGTVNLTEGEGATVYSLMSNYDHDCTITIVNGSYILNSAKDCLLHSSCDKGLIIKGGNFELGNVGKGHWTGNRGNGSPWIINVNGQNTGAAVVSGGTYNYDISNQRWIFEVDIQDGKGNLGVIVNNGDGTWTVTGETAEVGIVNYFDGYEHLTGYATFKDAVASVAKGAPETTIKLLKNISVKGQFIGHSYAQKVIIDLNGYTMSSTDKTLTVYRAGTEVTVKNGTVYGNTTGGTIQVTYGGKLTLGEDVTVKSGGHATAIKVEANSTLIVDQDSTYVLGGKNDLVVADGANVQISAGYFKYPVKAEWCAPLCVPSGKLDNGYYSVLTGKLAKIGDAYYTSIQEAVNDAADGDTITVLFDHELTWDGETKIDGSMASMVVVAGKSVTIDLNGKKLTVDANKMNGTDLYAVFAADEGGSLTLTGNGTVEATGVGFNSGVTAYCLMMAYEPGTELIVVNGTYTMETAHDSLVYTGGDECAIVNGGTFTLGNQGTGTNGKPWIFNGYGKNANEVVVRGGTFNADVNHQFWANEVDVLETLALKNNGNGTWTVVDAAAYVEEIGRSQASYSRKVGYATVAEAYAAAKNGQQVTILNNGEAVLPEIVETNDVAALATNLANGGNVTMTESMTVSTKQTGASNGYGKTGVVVNGGSFNGNGQTLTVTNANATWDSALTVKSGSVQNVTITGAFRGISVTGAKGDVYINNVILDGVTYTVHCDAGNQKNGLYISNSTLNGWTSFANSFKEVVFTDCTFGEGNGHAYCRPYNKVTVFSNCVFEEGFTFDASQASGIVFENCYYGETLITAENASQIAMFGNRLNGAVIK